MHHTRRFSPLVVFAALVVVASANRATFADPPPASPELRANIKQMFADGWEPSADGLAAAERHYRQAKTLEARDPRVDFAWALMQLKYLKFNEAERTLADVVKADGELWPARMLKIRLAVSMKKPTAALEQLEELTSATVSAPSSLDRTEAIEFVGRIVAFYEGPGARGVAATTVADSRRRIAAKLTPTDQEPFDRGYAEVDRQFRQLSDDKERTAEAAKAAEVEQKLRDLERLDAEKANVESAKNDVQAQADESERRARELVAQIDSELAPLNAAFAQISARGQIVQAEIIRLDSLIGSLLAQADATDDPAARAALLSQADFARLPLSRAQADYQALDIQAAQINVQRAALAQRRGQVVNEYDAEMKRLGRTAVKLAGNEQRIATQTKTALAPATGRTPQVQTKETHAASLATYVELSLDREKQRLLSSLEE